ncbi:hypothetical protein QBC38DRAFT_95131 [Podospora fimiseda]|uniref:Transcription factor domain-containing protein n=1 Tax=Podospora fimiseda TaxID=252190 RepID=A0AAN7BZ82_9PEZI|nr:hypothetical protein QBC38DRAFT_95131 [Podospora fimiseda]
MQVDDEVTDSFDALRLQHETSINDLVPFISSEEEGGGGGGADDSEMNYEWLNSNNDTQSTCDGTTTSSVISSHASSLPVGASALSTPPSSTLPLFNITSGTGPGRGRGRNRMVASLGLQPQFNLDSAAKLLNTFTRLMLNRFHCVPISEEDSVASLAQRSPFVLLAILAASSGSRTLQGHSLYDEEFRKILGLKYVAGGERNLDLLQGLVVYIAWYPFHLRPKNKQALQYIRMAVDIVVDLELDQDPETDSLDIPPSPSRLDEIRTYIACYYLSSSFACTWGRTPPLLYTSFTAKCCDMLERHSAIKGDQILVWKVRLQRLIEETNDLRRTNRGHSQSEYQIGLMIRGMETQLSEWEERMTPEYITIPTVRLAILFTRLFLSGAPLLKLPSVKLPALDAASSFRADPVRLLSSIPTLHTSYEYFLSLSAEEINSFTGVEWGGFILSVILGFRMSFPLVVCPEWSDKTARGMIRFGDYMDRMCKMGEENNKDAAGFVMSKFNAATGEKEKENDKSQPPTMDVLSASKVVLGVVRKKFLSRVAKVEGMSLQSPSASASASASAPPPPAAPVVQQQQHSVFQMPVSVPVASPTNNATRGKVQHDPSIGGCPMMDGSLEGYYPLWDEMYATTSGLNMAAGASHHHHHHHHNHQHAQHVMAVSQSQSPTGMVPVTTTGMDLEGAGISVPMGQDQDQQQQQQNVVYDDLWAAMTMGWATQAGGMSGFGGV